MARRQLLLALLMLAPGDPSPGAQARWRVSERPVLILGAAESDTSQLFEVVAGATRLPDGKILVGDRDEYSLYLFAPDGRRLRSFGRKGGGPGELDYLARLWRCGDSVVTYDIAGHRASVFDLDGRFVRMFRFGSPETGAGVPYGSACNRRGLFVHLGWGDMRPTTPNNYRPLVAYWTGRADSSVLRPLGRWPGSERRVHVIDGQIVGSGPLQFGRQPEVAIGSDRIYLGIAERYEILVFSTAGDSLQPIRKPRPPVPVTAADTRVELQRRLATARPDRRKAIEADHASYPYPKVLPPYAALRVDAEDHLWVQDYPRSASATVLWSVFNPAGTQVAEVVLPRDLEVFEIGTDYVLGRYVDPDEAIPQVRIYRLERRKREAPRLS